MRGCGRLGRLDERGSEDHRPEPYWQQQLGRIPGRRLGGPASDATRRGLDGHGRVVLAEMLSGGRVWARDLLRWTDSRVEAVRARGKTVEELAVLAVERGRPLERIACAGLKRVDGRLRVEVIRYAADAAGRITLALRVYESGGDLSRQPELGPYWGSTATRFDYDPSGELRVVEHVVGPSPIARGKGHDAALAEALAGLDHGSETASVVWDGRLHRREDQRPAPEAALDGLAAPMADAIVAATTAAGDTVKPLAFVDVLVSGYLDRDQLRLPAAAAAGVAFRDRARQHATPDELLALAHRSSEGAAKLDVAGAASPELLRRFRAAARALGDDAAASREATARLARNLARELDARAWSAADAAFLAVVQTDEERATAAAAEWDPEEAVDGDEGDEFDEIGEPRTRRPALRLRTMREVVGDERVDAFAASLADAGASRRADVERDLRVADRAELVVVLEQAGLDAHVARRAADDAAWAIVLEPDPEAQSRLGGPGVLPVGMPWPTADGRPLTHLATIALSEVPEVEGRDLLPPDGHLAFFADLSEEGEFYEPLEPGEPDRQLAAVVHTPASLPRREETPAEPPGRAEYDPPLVLKERRVRPTPRLQLRDVGFGLAERLFGTDAVGAHVLECVHHAVNGAIDHQLLGFPSVVQDDPRGPGQIALFHIAHDPELGFEFLDAGDLLFFGGADDIRACRWDRLTVWPSSC